MEYMTVAEAIESDGLRIVLVQGMPSPWSQAAKTMMEIKNLEYVTAPLVPGGTNDEIVAWAGENSAPVVAWNDQKPLTKWNDILFLLERLSPTPRMIPDIAEDRVIFFGLCHEICGELGIGWNRRLQLFGGAIASGSAPDGIKLMAGKYGHNEADVIAAGKRTAATLDVLARVLKEQHELGNEFFVGDCVSALDIYWVAFANLLDPLPADKNPMPEEFRPGFVAQDPEIKAAMDPLLFKHRDRIFDQYFRCPMEY